MRQRVKALILIGEAAEKIKKALDDLTQTVMAAELREAVQISQRLSFGGLTLDVDQHRLLIDGRATALTPTEFELLRLFMENPGHTYTREELLEKTLGYSYEGTGRTLDTHILNLRHKIEADPRHPVYIQTVHRIG